MDARSEGASGDRAMKIPAPNYTQIPNVIFDAIKDMEGGELAVILIICRLTFGWHKERAKISLSGLTTATGYTRPGIVKSIQSLEKRGWIFRTKDKQGFEYQVAIELVNSVNQCQETQLPTPVNSVNQPEPAHINGKERSKESDPAGAELEKQGHRIFVETWCKEYPDFFGVEYSFQGGKDGQAVKRLLKVSPVAELIRVARIAWRHQGTYPFKCATGIAMFYSHINEIRAAAQKLAPAPVATTEDSWGPEALKRVINGQQRT